MKYNLSFKDFLLYGKLGTIKLGCKKQEVEKIFGFKEYELLANSNSEGIELVCYESFNLQFYYNKSGILINFHLRDDVICYPKRKDRKKKTRGEMELLFSDFELFYAPPLQLIEMIIDNNINLFYIDKLSNEYSNYFYVTSNNVKIFFNPFISEVIDGAGLGYIGSDLGSIIQASENNAIEITKDNIIIPPLYNEIEQFPNGKKIR